MLTPVAFAVLPLLSCQWTPGGFICNLCNTSCFLGFTDLACEPLKIMFVIPTIDSALGANWIKQHNENWVLYPFSKLPFPVCCVSRKLPWGAASVVGTCGHSLGAVSWVTWSLGLAALPLSVWVNGSPPHCHNQESQTSQMPVFIVGNLALSDWEAQGRLHPTLFW